MNLVSISGHSFDLDLLPRKPRVLDVGARNFKFSLGILDYRPEAEILALEPNPSVARAFSHPNVKLQSVALVGDRRRIVAYLSASTGEGNYVREVGDSFNNPEGWTCKTVPARDIRDITDISTQQKWDLVKLDCEGSEFGILENWPLGGLAGQISVEFHDYKNPLKWNDQYWPWLWSQLPDYEVVQHEKFKQGEAFSHWDTLLRRR